MIYGFIVKRMGEGALKRKFNLHFRPLEACCGLDLTKRNGREGVLKGAAPMHAILHAYKSFWVQASKNGISLHRRSKIMPVMNACQSKS